MGMTMIQNEHKGQHYLRGEWKIVKPNRGNPNKGYIPSYERKGFDESKIIKIPKTGNY